jgi:type I restriction enzyme M protein
VQAFGQEINSQTCAIACSLLVMKGTDPDGIAFGNSLTNDQHAGATFDYLAAVPPFGAEWKKVQAEVTHEADTLGFAGRFGAGLPRINDSSFLFLQHMIAHMKPADEGGSRIAIVFNASPLFTGAAGSGESEIRRWILENDLLEGIIALPDQLFLNTGIPTYLWLLSNRKRTANKGKVIVLNARTHCSTMRKPLGNKQQYITDEQIVEITRLYAQAADGSSNAEAADKGAVRLVRTDYFGYQRIAINRPLRLRFAVTDTTIAQLEQIKALARFQAADALLSVLRSLTGETWSTKAAFAARLSSALTQAGLTDRVLPPALRQAVLRAVGIADSAGEIQRDSNGAPLPDPDLRYYAKVPLSESVDAFMRREIAPEFPDAWTDEEVTRIGYEIQPTLFFANQWGVGFGPLAKVARQVPHRPFSKRTDNDLPLLRGRDLRSVVTAADLPELSGAGRSLAPCTDGDIVGQLANWRVLPAGFGHALTPLTVLRPLQNSGRTLCEWLNTRKSSEYGLNPQISMDTPVPIAAIRDLEFDELLDDLHIGRIALASTMSKILPNVFHEPTTDIEDARRTARAGASEARLIGELVRPLEDPVWRSEWSYPYHIAGLARQYRIATSPAERKDALLKLGESVARTLGILALAVMIRREGRFTRKMRDRFRNGGASFGTWNRLIQDLLTDGEVSELRELAGSLGPAGAHTLLTSILDVRNEARHEYGVHAAHELEDEVATLEPVVVGALESVSWLSGLHWNLVERCEYTGTGFKLIGQRLRGSHPEWEPFERSRVEPLAPHRIYVEGPSSADPIALWPIASAELCPICGTRELFLLKEVMGKVITLRSGKDHEINRELD